MLGSDRMVGTAQGVFEVAEGGVDPFEGGHGDGPGSGAGGYRMMRTAPRGDGGEAVEPVAENGRPRAQVALGHLGDLALAEALDAAQLDAHGLALRRGLDGDDERRLARRAPAALGPGTAAAEVGIVHLHPPGERQFGVALEHGLHQFLLDLPGRGLGDAEPPAEFEGGDPFLRLGHVIDRREPQGQRQLGRVEERAGGQRDLMTAGGALVEFSPGDLAMARGATSGAGEPLRPAPAEQGLATLLLGTVQLTKTRLAEPLLELNLVAWHCEPPEKPPNVHDLHHINPAE